ncbi:hypothetical protein [Methanobacterium spitsbergense]|uniref:Uncharacterized protein n=1 Tax=Methanobacterium spitsbergense TaxID=2874285 RepID=A0A8T5UND0_9EURY|nr:hypothetical protein [Methanobacterium spitsbergense]MBZ2165472.1 hypothetical protein [Methanobacterium spitsbergense]
MRVSEGIPNGQIAELSHPEMFQEHEEVILFTRNEFNRFYTSMMEQIKYINKIDLYLDRSEDWKLIGYWPKILQRVHLLDRNIDSILTKEESLQCYLDASLHNAVRSIQKNVEVTKRKVEIQQTLQI